MNKVLLHICCANCATVCIQRLQSDGFAVSGFFYNPNIHPEQEYHRRANDLEKISRELSCKIIEARYDQQPWRDFIKGHEQDSEWGERCRLCFTLRLQETYNKMISEHHDLFTTTLTISPHKNSKLINDIGISLNSARYLVRDFKKQGGFQQSIVRSKDFHLYRQHYCGCVYSARK